MKLLGEQFRLVEKDNAAHDLSLFINLAYLQKDYISEEEGKIVVYMTSCGVVHSTWERCHAAVVLLQNLNIKVELRDLNLDTNLVDELIDRLQLGELLPFQEDRNFVYDNLPLIYVNGFYFGVKILYSFFSFGRRNCETCDGIGYTLCPDCRGSKRSKHTFHDLILRCANCDENGIVLCKQCLQHPR
ncbi:unnamed protein product [Enterobius vermicularis]|uniref:Glutaredoxin domain-containing protein n=1 Tax=Enterobius vermicularis TaxID=51028 RepID=A0A0N4VDL2_ENTVE|nr:unnamed protein product [Enterobius vermicularis]